MSDSEPRRRAPGAFRLDELGTPRAQAGRGEADAEATVSAREARQPRAFEDVTALRLDPKDAIDREDIEALAVEPARPRRRSFSFGKLFLAATGLLFSLAVGLAVDELVRNLFARAEWLGWTALGLAILVLLGAIGLAARETIALMRLAAVDRERQRALAAYEANSERDAKQAVEGLVALVGDRSETAAGRRRLADLEDEIIDGADLLGLAEREVLGPLDKKARALILASAKRVSVVTAVSPKALVDVAYVLFETVGLIRRMSELYGARPGTLGLIRLTRDVIGHLAVTGSIGIGDGLVQQLVGHGVAAKLSARLGEGVVNGLLTARVGLAAMDLCRPLPFLTLKRPSITAVVSDLTDFRGSRNPASGASEGAYRGG